MSRILRVRTRTDERVARHRRRLCRGERTDATAELDDSTRGGDYDNRTHADEGGVNSRAVGADGAVDRGVAFPEREGTDRVVSGRVAAGGDCSTAGPGAGAGAREVEGLRLRRHVETWRDGAAADLGEHVCARSAGRRCDRHDGWRDDRYRDCRSPDETLHATPPGLSIAPSGRGECARANDRRTSPNWLRVAWPTGHALTRRGAVVRRRATDREL